MPQLYELNLRDYWNIFLKRKTIIFLSFLVVFSSVFTYTNFQTPLYMASALLKIDPYPSSPSEILFPSAGVQYWQPWDEISDYTKQIVSRPVLEAAAEELGWITRDMGKKEKESLISEINSQISASEVKGGPSRMMTLKVKGPDPQRISDLANKISEVFKIVNAGQKNERVRNVRIFIENKLDDVTKGLREQDERLRDLTTRGAVGTGVHIVNQIYELENMRTNLTTKFTELHPEVIRVDEQIAELKRELEHLPKEEFEYGILKRDIAINEKLYTSLREKLQEAQINEAERIDNIILVNPAVAPKKPFYPDKGKNYVVGVILGFLLGVTSALITEHLDTSIGRVDDVESFIKTSVVGIIPYCTEKRRGADKIEKSWQRWQRIFFKKKAEKKIVFEEVPIFELERHYSSLFLEAFRILTVNLQVMFGEGGRIKNKILMLTSCNPEEGKTIVTSNLGIVLAQMGYKVLIVDTDVRRAHIHRIFGLNKEEGLTDILTGKSSPDTATRTATDLMLGAGGVEKIMEKQWLNNLNIITAGAVFPNPINLFNSDKMNETLAYFRNKYDVVLLDSSPILAVSEPSIIVPKTDGVFLVYRAGVTSRLALRRAKTQLESVKGKGALSGVILNSVTPEISMDTYYYYGRKYYVYGEEKDSRDVKKEGGGGHV